MAKNTLTPHSGFLPFLGKTVVVILVLILLLWWLRGCTVLPRLPWLRNNSGSTSVAPTTTNYYIQQYDKSDIAMNFSNMVKIDARSQVYSEGFPVRSGSDWHTDWEVRMKLVGGAKGDVQMNIPGQVPSAFTLTDNDPHSSTVTFSLRHLPTTGVFTVNYRSNENSVEFPGQGRVVQDLGVEGAILEMKPQLNPEQQAQIDEVEELVQGTTFQGWGKQIVNFPSQTITIKKGATVPGAKVTSTIDGGQLSQLSTLPWLVWPLLLLIMIIVLVALIMMRRKPAQKKPQLLVALSSAKKPWLTGKKIILIVVGLILLWLVWSMVMPFASILISDWRFDQRQTKIDEVVDKALRERGM
jgi:hypothetical protein